MEFLLSAAPALEADEVVCPSSDLPALAERLKADLCESIDHAIAAVLHTADHGVAPEHLRSFAMSCYNARRKRDRLTPPGIMGEPAWDILLLLFAMPDGANIKYVCYSSGIPYSTGWRWLSLLEAKGFLGKHPDADDARRIVAKLTPEGLKIMSRILHDMRLALKQQATAVSEEF